MELEPIFFSIAGYGSNDAVDALLHRLQAIPNLNKQSRTIIDYTLDCSAAGSYPAKSYYLQFYPSESRVYTLAEMQVLVSDIEETYRRMRLLAGITEVASTTHTSQDFAERLRGLLDKESVSDAAVNLQGLDAWTYAREEEQPHGDGMLMGVPEIDDLTSGFQPGNVASICAFTGGGKTVTCLSVLFKNARKGKKCVYVSLELDPHMIWLMLETRYMYEVKGISLNSQDLLFHKLSGDKKQKVLAAEGDFKRDICQNVLVVDTSIFTQDVMTDVSRLRQLYQTLCRVMGGLDMIVYDHVNQLDLLFQGKNGTGLGNQILVKLREAGKTSPGVGGILPSTIFAVQCNREGYKRARKRGGVYDMTAIGDLSEVERTSSYVVFLYADEMSGETQEFKVMMAKHRLGRILPEPVTASFLPGVCCIGESVEMVSFDGDFAAMGDAFGGGSSFEDTFTVKEDF